MSKRKSEVQPPAKKQPRSSTQSTLHNFFGSSTGGSNAHPRTIEPTPQFLGIHTFSDQDITSSSGLDKDYKVFWNA